MDMNETKMQPQQPRPATGAAQRAIARQGQEQLRRLYSMPPEWSDESPRLEGLVWISHSR